VVGGAMLPAGRTSAQQQTTVRLVVGYTAGGGVDSAARIIARALQPALSPSVIVDNRPGAGSTIGTRAVVDAPADGSVGLFASSSGIVVAPAIYKNLSYDPRKDLTSVALVSYGTSVLAVRADLPVRTLGEFIAWAKRNPEGVSFGSSGVGTGPHLQGQRLVTLLGVKGLHVPYRGGAQALTDLVAGRVDFMIDFLGLCLPQIRAGGARALAVIARAPSPELPDVPTMQQAGLPQMDGASWNGVFLPPQTPRPITERWAAALKQAIAEPDAAQAMTSQGSEVVYMGPDEFARFVAEEVDKWKRIAEAAGIEPQ
jgi:tripartite-type tricarboxylate transporter receptor subunit TctC